MAEIVSLADAVAELVHDGDTVAAEGFTHLIPFAAGHELSAAAAAEILQDGGNAFDACVAGPGPVRFRPSGGVRPRYSGLRVQGTASSPPSATGRSQS